MNLNQIYAREEGICNYIWVLEEKERLHDDVDHAQDERPAVRRSVALGGDVVRIKVVHLEADVDKVADAKYWNESTCKW